MRCLNLGSGCDYKKKGCINLDRQGKADVYHDLEKTPLPFKSNYFDKIICRRILAHITNIQPLIKDLHRILKPNGILEITTAFGGNLISHHIDHKNYFTPHSFDCYFKWNKNYGEPYPKFDKISIKLRVMKFHFFVPQFFEILTIFGINIFSGIQIILKKS